MSEDIEVAVRATGRSCRECSLCCKLPPIDTPELQKQANTWCPHCRPGKGGCSIYETRPTLCRNYRCLWLKDAALGEEWKPSHCRMYLHFTSAGLAVVVDPGYPEQWRQEWGSRHGRRAPVRGLTRRGYRDDRDHVASRQAHARTARSRT
jgi:hypothetical protein